eukprot:scaffold941_cov81-Phaeocystis_antarctica.AAC.8
MRRSPLRPASACVQGLGGGEPRPPTRRVAGTAAAAHHWPQAVRSSQATPLSLAAAAAHRPRLSSPAHCSRQ